MIHLMELPNPDPLEGRPQHGGRDRHFCVGASRCCMCLTAALALPSIACAAAATATSAWVRLTAALALALTRLACALAATAASAWVRGSVAALARLGPLRAPPARRPPAARRLRPCRAHRLCWGCKGGSSRRCCWGPRPQPPARLPALLPPTREHLLPRARPQVWRTLSLWWRA